MMWEGRGILTATCWSASSTRLHYFLPLRLFYLIGALIPTWRLSTCCIQLRSPLLVPNPRERFSRCPPHTRWELQKAVSLSRAKGGCRPNSHFCGDDPTTGSHKLQNQAGRCHFCHPDGCNERCNICRNAWFVDAFTSACLSSNIPRDPAREGTRNQTKHHLMHTRLFKCPCCGWITPLHHLIYIL